MTDCLRCAVLTISDRSSAGERPDVSGPALIEQIKQLGWQVIAKKIVPDNIELIQNALREVANTGSIDVLFTTGGTGCAPRDVTPEATLAVIEKNIPGLAEAMRMESLKLNPHAMLSRGLAGIYHNTLIINLPGSPKGAVENFEIVAPVLAHAVALIQSDPDAESGHQFKH
jgi:molybdenum cofactor synthesis domain-containing protein